MEALQVEVVPQRLLLAVVLLLAQAVVTNLAVLIWVAKVQVVRRDRVLHNHSRGHITNVTNSKGYTGINHTLLLNLPLQHPDQHRLLQNRLIQVLIHEKTNGHIFLRQRLPNY